jgi:hypothetical protein
VLVSREVAARTTVLPESEAQAVSAHVVDVSQHGLVEVVAIVGSEQDDGVDVG